MEFSAGLNTFQADQVNERTNNQTSPYTQLVPSALVATTNAHVQQSGCSLTIRAMPTQLLHKKPNKCPNETARRFGDSFETIVRQL